MDISEVARIISANGGRLYLVGGAVRDLLMKKRPHDFDYCVVGLDTDAFSKIFPEAIIRGKAFPVFDMLGCEFALARKEVKVAEGHKGFEMIADKNVTIEDDLKRRDITINSIAMDVLRGDVVDPYGGILDIERKVIRATSNAFLEDPLRSYRVARFAAELGFEVTDSTIELMKMTRNEIGLLSSERVFVEFEKALNSSKPSLFFDVLRRANLLEVHFKEVFDLIGVVQPLKYHPEGDAYNHTMIVIDKIASSVDSLNCDVDSATEISKSDRVLYVFAGLVHDFGKALTPKDMLPRHLGHESKGLELAKNLCRRLKFPTRFEKVAVTACLEHMRAGVFYEMRAGTKVDFLERVYKSVLGLEGLELLANADNTKGFKIRFANLGEEMMKNFDAKEYVDEFKMCGKDIDYVVLKEKVRADRVRWIQTTTSPL